MRAERRMLHKVTARVAAGGLLAASGVTALAGVALADPAPKYTICHSTNSETNPYVEITVNESAVDGSGKNDHTHHTGPIWQAGDKANGINWGDILPPTPGAPNGLNWDADGQAILANHCVMPNTPPGDPVAPDMETDKSGTASAHPGDPVSYTVTVQNVGTGPTTGTTVVTDTLPTGLVDGTMAYAAGDGSWTCDAAASATPSCSTSDVLAVGASTDFTVTSAVNASLSPLPQKLTDEAAVATPDDSDSSNDTDTFDTTVNAKPVTPPDETPASVAFSDDCDGITVTTTTADQHTTVFDVTAPDGTPDTITGSDSRTYAVDSTHQSLSVSYDGTGPVNHSWDDPGTCTNPQPEPEPTAAPTLGSSTTCQNGISVVLGNLAGTADVDFTVVDVDGKTHTVPVRAGQLVKQSYAVSEDTTGTVTVSAPGLAKKTVSYAKDCADVLGEKETRHHHHHKAAHHHKTAVLGEKSTLPFTGFELRRALLEAAALMLLGSMLCMLAARRQRGVRQS